jgi:hypothetical protein
LPPTLSLLCLGKRLGHYINNAGAVR